MLIANSIRVRSDVSFYTPRLVQRAQSERKEIHKPQATALVDRRKPRS